MKPIRKILVPVDFSADSIAAIDWAIGFARRYEAEIELLHSYDVSPLLTYGVDLPGSLEDDLRQAARRQLTEQARRVAAAGLRVRDHIVREAPAPAIAQHADAWGADLIVMGTRGRSGIQHVLLGSVAERTIRRATCPVTIVRGGVAAREIRKILVPVDLSAHARRALDDAIELAGTWDAEIHLLHCYLVRPESIDLYGIAVSETLDHDLRQAALRRLDAWRDDVRARTGSVEVHIAARAAGEEIPAAGERLGVDLIAMGTRGLSGLRHALLGSVTESTLRVAPCPVWVSPPSEKD